MSDINGHYEGVPQFTGLGCGVSSRHTGDTMQNDDVSHFGLKLLFKQNNLNQSCDTFIEIQEKLHKRQTNKVTSLKTITQTRD